MKKFYAEGGYYHVFNKSIANFGIFKDSMNCVRFIETLDYYNDNSEKERYSYAIKFKRYLYKDLLVQRNNSLVKYISYCIMPDHYHLLIKVLTENRLSKLINNLENSYTRYFNLKFKRKGPLWQNRFKAVLIESNEHLLHVSRYIHLNPVTSYLADKPEDWPFSSYRKYILDPNYLKQSKEISVDNNNDYKNFVENNIDYQRKLRQIKKLMID